MLPKTEGGYQVLIDTTGEGRKVRVPGLAVCNLKPNWPSTNIYRR